jgi:Cytochrome P460
VLELENEKMSARLASLIVSLAFLTAHQTVTSQAGGGHNGFDLVDKAGSIRKLADVRDLYQLLGTYTVELDPKGEEMHVTYASPGAAQYYRKSGKFADGTVLVKEVLGTDHAAMTTGDAHWASDTKVWFVMIKDDKNRYPNNPLWGDGWGWALFKANAPDKQVATNYKKDCLGCHLPAQSTEWVYVQGYPVLKSK